MRRALLFRPHGTGLVLAGEGDSATVLSSTTHCVRGGDTLKECIHVTSVFELCWSSLELLLLSDIGSGVKSESASPGWQEDDSISLSASTSMAELSLSPSALPSSELSSEEESDRVKSK